jgi:trimethylamine monooxygenase
MAAKDTTAAASKDVLVIGAGPSGMAQVNSLAGTSEFNVRCFEMNSEIGGLWTWTADVGECHGSMYRYHQTNGLNEFLELPDYSFLEHFGHLITSYPPRAVMLDYLTGWTKKMGGDKCITVNRKVLSVTYQSEKAKFKVISQDVKTASRHLDFFDNVVVCSGHFSVPSYPPEFQGIEGFKGFQIHAHSFRDAQDYKGKHIMLVGNGYSGEDIAMQTVKFGAASATVVYRTEPMGHDFEDWPIAEKPLPTHYDGESDEFRFADGSALKVDGVIYCTGYKHHFPFLSDELQLITKNRLVPDMLWKGIVHPNNTALTFIGMPDQYYTFTMFHTQAQFVRGLLEGRVQVPSRVEMLADVEAWQEKEDIVHSSGDHASHHELQLAYTNDAAQMAGVSMRDDGDLLCQWQADRHRSILTYRDCTAKSKVDGTSSLVYYVPWTKMFTDDTLSYLSWCKAQTDTLAKEGMQLGQEQKAGNRSKLDECAGLKWVGPAEVRREH